MHEKLLRDGLLLLAAARNVLAVAYSSRTEQQHNFHSYLLSSALRACWLAGPRLCVLGNSLYTILLFPNTADIAITVLLYTAILSLSLTLLLACQTRQESETRAERPATYDITALQR